MNKLQDEYFGNYRGIVKQHGEKGLCKIYFPGVFPVEYEKNIVKLPWAQPAMPIFGGSNANGTFIYPDINSTIWAFFEAGNINMPIYFAQTNNNKTQFVSEEYNIKYNNVTIKFDKDNLEVKNSSDNSVIIIDTKTLNIANADKVDISSKEVNVKSTVTATIDSPILNIKAPVLNINPNTTLNIAGTPGATGSSSSGFTFINGICTVIGA